MEENVQTSMNYGFYIVGIDMQYGREGYFANVRTIRTWTRIQIIGCKSYLVIDNNMDCSIGFVAI